jgi:hypothetical protein
MKTRSPSQRRRTSRIREPEQGMALFITVFVLLLIGAVAVAAINHSREEATAGGRARATMRTFYSADSGIQLALMHIAQNPPNLNPFNITIDGGRTVQSRTRADATPQPLVRTGFGPPPEGYEINVGSAFFNEIFLVNVTSTAPNGASAELEARLARLQAGSGGL